MKYIHKCLDELIKLTKELRNFLNKKEPIQAPIKKGLQKVLSKDLNVAQIGRVSLILTQ